VTFETFFPLLYFRVRVHALTWWTGCFGCSTHLNPFFCSGEIGFPNPPLRGFHPLFLRSPRPGRLLQLVFFLNVPRLSPLAKVSPISPLPTSSLAGRFFLCFPQSSAGPSNRYHFTLLPPLFWPFSFLGPTFFEVAFPKIFFARLFFVFPCVRVTGLCPPLG